MAKRMIVTDNDGVVWAVDRKFVLSDQGVALWQPPGDNRIKVFDPNFVHERVPTPKMLDWAIGATVLLMAAGIVSFFF